MPIFREPDASTVAPAKTDDKFRLICEQAQKDISGFTCPNTEVSVTTVLDATTVHSRNQVFATASVIVSLLGCS